MHTVIEVQLPSQAELHSGITFPMKDNNISVKSEIPSSTISMQIAF